ncbi:MAG: transposase [Sedimentisphaerales bacterium]|nr:transposase [Sedimentisphaerales bacterium]
MIGNQQRWQEDLFVAGPLSNLIPNDHILKLVDKAIDLSWLRQEVSDCYNEAMGRPSIDPESALRLMLAGYFQGIVHDRKLMREAQVNLAIRWFAGFRLHEVLPEHSSLTKIRHRWGPERFKKIFQKTVRMCIDAGLVNGETVHIDSTLIRADVSWESLTTEYADKVIKENRIEDDDGDSVSRKGKPKKRSTTDPDATLTTSSHTSRMEPFFKQHTAVDDHSGVILDVKTTTGEASEGKELLEQISRIEGITEKKVRTVTADMAYAHSDNYSQLEQHGTEAVIPPQTSHVNARSVPICRFKYDSRNEIVRCPRGKILRRSCRTDKGWFYRSAKKNCAGCPLRTRCISSKAKGRLILITDGYESLLRARRRWQNRDENIKDKYTRHKWRVEGIHGEAKTQHGLRRAVRRGLANVSIQVYLTAMVMNLKRLAALLCLFFVCLKGRKGRGSIFELIEPAFYRILPRWRKYFLFLKIAA